jgi:NTE family protein
MAAPPSARKKVFLVFEGGGAKGIVHVGALRALEKRGVEIAGVAGTSAGAIVASLVAASPTRRCATASRDGDRGASLPVKADSEVTPRP